MAITAKFYPSAVKCMFNGTMNAGSTYKMALLSSSGSFSGSHTLFSSLTAHQVSGSGYTAGGATVTVGPATSDSSKTNIPVGSASWADASVTFQNAVIYETGGGNLLIHLAFDYEQEVLGQTFTINTPSPAPSATPL